MIGLTTILVGAALNARWLTRPLERQSRASALGSHELDLTAALS